MSSRFNDWMHKIELSSVLTVIGIILLFSGAVVVTLWAPRHMDPTWIEPTSHYQVQMYEVMDPNFFISSTSSQGAELQSVYRLQRDYSLLAFQESEVVRILAPKELEEYVTRYGEPMLKLTSRLMLLRPASSEAANPVRSELQNDWEVQHPNWKQEGLQKPAFDILELYEPSGEEAFAVATTDQITESWVDANFKLMDPSIKQPWHAGSGVVYVNNPIEYRVKFYTFGSEDRWRYDPEGDPVNSVAELTAAPLGFRSRKEMITMGEHIYAIEGCWYCHTDQTRTLVQDVVANGSAEYPAPPSSANEYIYQKISFPGTRRIGPDLSRVGIKRPSRDWHKGHFWSPKTASKGSIMPAFQHFFDFDPRGTGKSPAGIPNYKFEAIFQYLMTKGTRITPPTEAWWLGKDPVNTKEIIEGKKKQ